MLLFIFITDAGEDSSSSEPVSHISLLFLFTSFVINITHQSVISTTRQQLNKDAPPHYRRHDDKEKQLTELLSSIKE